MFIPKKCETVRLFAADGNSWAFPSLSAFIKAYGLTWIRSSIGAQFRVRRVIDPTLGIAPIWCEYPFILRSDDGAVLTVEDCERLWRQEQLRTRLSWQERRYRFWKGSGPVPYTGRRSAGSHYFRAIRTYPSHRAALGVVKLEGEPSFRGKRRKRYLPSAWDDRQISARRDRSWKRHRRTQYASRNAHGLRRSSRCKKRYVISNLQF